MGKKRILVVDDEKDIVELVAFNLEREGLAVQRAFDGEKALQLIGEEKPDLLILDLMLPGLSGLDVCRIVRQQEKTETLPIIMLTAKGEPLDKILGLEMGADDYITKPFDVRELIARVRAVLRRSNQRTDSGPGETFTFRGLHFDYRTYQVSVDGKKIDLGPTEIKLLRFLTRQPGRVFSRDQLLDSVWGDEAFVEPRTVDVHISRLRAEIEKNKDKPQYVLTVRGIGYKFADPKEPFDETE
ncbi:two-component system, OmpR family, alkaline phosphatase synthesis response regulator PhoP [Syntrophus gentianae]|uniref:Phosphate regulon transcriptional regulatory protein PhoB n=1 Tax=Syntrophus gentianae TaxID=43775 RepID=A0A1H7WW06_9BACT|nr:response regulator [Syntrophus gentianae]SEM25544.1 two-component system, OmpR family, alkaline phosphatase synthesis response regulator PhoP [Syntrophus gentianae]